jgi:hypothetical protein
MVALDAIFSVDSTCASPWARHSVNAVLDPTFLTAVRRLEKRQPTDHLD